LFWPPRTLCWSRLGVEEAKDTILYTLCDKGCVLRTFRTFLTTWWTWYHAAKCALTLCTLARTSPLICLRTTRWGPRCLVGHYRRYHVLYSTTSTVEADGECTGQCLCRCAISQTSQVTLEPRRHVHCDNSYLLTYYVTVREYLSQILRRTLSII
jgi:hypothetical protein